MIQVLAAVLLALHGVIHLVGFVTPWHIATLQGFTIGRRSSTAPWRSVTPAPG